MDLKLAEVNRLTAYLKTLVVDVAEAESALRTSGDLWGA